MTNQTEIMVDVTQTSSYFKLSPSRLLGLGLMTLLVIAAITGPALIGGDPNKQSLLHTLEGPSIAHPLGTDNLGRDMASRLLSGAQLSLSLAFLSVITAGLPGAILGVTATWFGGWPDRLLGAFADAVLALPGLLLVLMLAAISPG